MADVFEHQGPETATQRASATPASGEERYGDRLFHHEREQELERLLALAAALDSASCTRLAALGIGNGWRCLDVGSGAGSVARWLADQGAEVVAVDRDTRFLADAEDMGIRVVEADVRDESFHPGLFHLVHARFVLMHLRDRDSVLQRMAQWVRPGGWLVVSDAADLGTASSPHEGYRRTMVALWRAVAEAIGTDVDYGRRYPAALAGCGLVDLGAAVDMPAVAAGTPWAEFWSLTLRQCRPLVTATGLVDEVTIDRTLDYLNTPGTWDLSEAMITAWGRRIGGDRVL